MTNINDLLAIAAGRNQVSCAVACPDDDHVLSAVSEAHKLGIGNFILVGDKSRTQEIAGEHSIDISGFEFVDIADKTEACSTAAKLVSEGKAGCLMKGLIDTSVILKAVLSKELGLRTERRLTHLAVFQVPAYHKLLLVTDAAINLSPDYDGFIDIIANSVNAALKLGIARPKVAMLAAKEKPDPKMPVTMIYQQLLENSKGLDELADLAGPLALDNAVSKESAITKGVTGPVAGDADILVCPDIEAGNILYKSLSFLNTCESGGIVLGAKAPIVLTSRADSAKSKLISIALAICNSQN